MGRRISGLKANYKLGTKDTKGVQARWSPSTHPTREAERHQAAALLWKANLQDCP